MEQTPSSKPSAFVPSDSKGWTDPQNNPQSKSETAPDNALDPADPLVSVIIPAYNAEKFIERTLKSVTNQTYRHFEVLIIDDGSTDTTADIARRYAACDGRISLYQQSNAGVAAARNHGIDKAKGLLIAPLDADDIWERTYLKKQVQALSTVDSAAEWVYSWSVDIDESDCATGTARISPYYGNVYAALLHHNIIGNASACVFRRSCVAAIGVYNADFLAQQAQGCEDWDFYIRLAEHYPVAVVPELLVGYRQVTGSMSSQRKAMEKSRQLTLKFLKEQHPHIYESVGRWTTSGHYQNAARDCFRAHRDAEAWAAFSQALKNDWLLTLTHYNNCTLLFQMCWRALTSPFSSQQERQQTIAHQQSFSEQPFKKRPLSEPPLGQQPPSSLSKIKLYFRLMMTLLLPRWLFQHWQIRWISTQVSPQRSGLEAISFTAVHRSTIDLKVKASQPNCLVDFAQ